MSRIPLLLRLWSDHLLLDFSRLPQIAVVENKGTAQAIRIQAEVAVFIFKGFAVLNNISRIAIRPVNSNSIQS